MGTFYANEESKLHSTDSSKQHGPAWSESHVLIGCYEATPTG